MKLFELNYHVGVLGPLGHDVIGLIVQELSDNDKIKLLRTCKYFFYFKFIFVKLTDATHCAKLPHIFTNVKVSKNIEQNMINKLSYSHIKKLTIDTILNLDLFKKFTSVSDLTINCCASKKYIHDLLSMFNNITKLSTWFIPLNNALRMLTNLKTLNIKSNLYGLIIRSGGYRNQGIYFNKDDYNGELIQIPPNVRSLKLGPRININHVQNFDNVTHLILEDRNGCVPFSKKLANTKLIYFKHII